MRMRDYLGVLLAFVADSIQIGTSVVTFGGDQFAVPVQVLFSAAVSAILALIMGPRKRLWPVAILEMIPFANILPGFTGAALSIALGNRRLEKARTQEIR